MAPRNIIVTWYYTFYATKTDNEIADADELKARLIDEWAQFDQSIVDANISQWRRRQIACVRVCGHTEHKF